MRSKIKILLIEDDQIERMKFKRCCPESQSISIIEASNGESAMTLLDDKMFPNLIVVDLNMPKMNGIEFLRKIKTKPELAFIPIIVLSTSNNFEDVKKCYEIGVSGYMIKPLHYEDYKKKIDALVTYWLQNELVLEV